MKDKAENRKVDDEMCDCDVDFHRILTSPHYEKLREKLIRVFARRGCAVPEDLADETVARVIDKLGTIVANYQGEPIRYFYAVARNVYYEYTRRPMTISFEENRGSSKSQEEPDAPEDDEIRDNMERCLAELSPDERRIIHEYYQYEKSGKIAHRRILAVSLGISLNALRLKAFRLRKKIHDCVAMRSSRKEDELNGPGRNETSLFNIMF